MIHVHGLEGDLECVDDVCCLSTLGPGIALPMNSPLVDTSIHDLAAQVGNGGVVPE